MRSNWVKRLYERDDNGREIYLFMKQCVSITGTYPKVTLSAHDGFWNPINEQIMSLPDVPANDVVFQDFECVEERPVFFFIYNLDNYYHFLYDSLPYLISYKELKKSIPELKLLVDSIHYRFIWEFLELFDIFESDVIFLNQNTLYQTVYISSSYTHDNKSNFPPRKEIYTLYDDLASRVSDNTELPKKIYISRRSSKHSQYDNMGTDYTTRRRLVNEDELVLFLESIGYVEVFTELLSTLEKIALFKNCTHVVGPIGGGLCNVLFSRPTTTLIPIVSPYFLDINGRMRYSFANVNTTYFYDTRHVEVSAFKQYMRVRIKNTNIIGEIQDIKNNTLGVSYHNEAVAGWNARGRYEFMRIPESEAEIIDPGLNSAWEMDMEKFRCLTKSVL